VLLLVLVLIAAGLRLKLVEPVQDHVCLVIVGRLRVPQPALCLPDLRRQAVEPSLLACDGDLKRVEGRLGIDRSPSGLGARQLGGLLREPSLLRGAEDRPNLEQTAPLTFEDLEVAQSLLELVLRSRVDVVRRSSRIGCVEPRTLARRSHGE
jgi:hypothetical protein